MKDAKTVLDHMLAPMIQKYLERLQTRELLLSTLIEKIESGPLANADRNALRKEAHQLAGSGATYGFPSISEAGFALEAALEAKLAEKDILPFAQALLQSCHAVQFLQSSSRQPVRKSAIANALPIQTEMSPDLLRSKTVLLIDDDPAIQDFVKKLLEHDAKVVVAPHVEMGTDLTRQHRPDLVLLDIDLPVANGMAYLRAMQQDEEFRHTPIVMLTVYRRGVDVVQAMRAGAVGYVIKPIDAATFPGYARALLLHTDTTVLIADDDETINDLLAVKFRSLGVRVLQARSSDAIPEIVSKDSPDMVIVDWKMAGLDPAAPEKALKAMCGAKTPKCVVLVGPLADKEEMRALWPNVDDCFAKPFTPAEVVTRCLKRLGLPGYEPMPSSHHTEAR
ncbi:MAG: response regulator [Bdellovibrionales bacterium]